jgi:hypothetical protein
MTEEQKDLLFKDLCARLPYNTKVQLTEYSDLTGEKLPSEIRILDYYMIGKVQAYCKGFRKDEVKPYLFPMSSMTEEQKEEHKDLLDNQYSLDANGNVFTLQDFYCKYHLDYRGFIPDGLAIDATGLGIYR